MQAADRTEITFADARIFPESLTSTKDGTLFFGSLGQDSVYRATPSSSKAEVWIQPKANGLSTVLGVLADEDSEYVVGLRIRHWWTQRSASCR